MRNILTLLLVVTALLFTAACDSPVAVPELDAPIQENSVECGTANDPCLLPPVGNDPGDSDPVCDPYLTLNGCGDECEESGPGSPEVVGVEGCSNPGGTGPGMGGGTEPPPPGCPEWDPYCENQPPPADTCNTGDPIIESPKVKLAFDELWNLSNGNAADPTTRLETGAWILSDGQGGYTVQHWSLANRIPCGMSFNETVPVNAVAFVHTHPWTMGESMVTCGRTSKGAYVTYRGLASGPDVAVARRLAGMRPGATGYILDKSGITTFSGTTAPDGGRDTRHRRCGY